MTIKKNSYLLRVDNCSRTIRFITFPFTCTINFKVLGNLLGKSAFLNIKTSSIILRITSSWCRYPESDRDGIATAGF